VDERDLVEPEGVNAESGEAQRDAGGFGDVVGGGDAAGAERQERPEPATELPGPPPEPAGSTDEVYGSQPPG
jgi:hypothetical protein